MKKYGIWKIFKVYDGEYHWYFAKSAGDAGRAHGKYLMECIGDAKEVNEYMRDLTVAEVAPTEVLTITLEAGDVCVHHQAAEWVALLRDVSGIKKPHLLCTTAY